MSLTQLPEHFQIDFGDNWNHLLQQKESRLENRVKKVKVNGKSRTISQLGKSKMRLITTRNGKTVPSNTAMAKRWIRPKGYDEVTYIDEFDDIALGELNAPESEHVVSHAMAAKRTIDEVIIAFAEGDNYIGENGTDAVAVPTSQKIAVDYVKTGSATNSGLTLAKILKATQIADANEVEQSGRYGVISSQQNYDLLNDVDEAKNSDYGSIATVVDGMVRKLGGWEFIMTQLLTLVTATDVRTCIFYQREMLCLGEGKAQSVKISIRDDLNETIQIRTKMLLDGTRTEEEGVILVFCDESV